MGGIGSGNRWQSSSHGICEHYKRISLADLRRRKKWSAGYFGTLSWSRAGEPAGSIVYRVHSESIQLLYRIRNSDDDQWTDIDEHIDLTSTEQPFGGRRTWFRCRSCQRRCAVLYGGSRFRCRKCYRLIYKSQTEDAESRAISKAHKLRRLLGGVESTEYPFPSKPKGMHWRTYARHVAEGERLDDNADRIFEKYVSRILKL